MRILQDNSVDAFPIAFVKTFFGTAGLPELDLANVSVHTLRLSLYQLMFTRHSPAVAPTSLVPAF